MTKIVVGVRAAGQAEPALDFALAEAVRRHLPLEVVHSYEMQVYAEVPAAAWAGPGAPTQADARQAATLAVTSARGRVPGGPSAQVRLEVVESDAAGALVFAARDADLLVVGSRGGGSIRRGTRGSVSAACLHHADVPVAVVSAHAGRSCDRWLRSRVLVAFDGSAAAQAALAWGAAQAREWGSLLTPMVVCPGYGRVPPALQGNDGRAFPSLPGLLRAHLETAGCCDLTVEPRFILGEPAEQLLREASPDDLLVVGSRGHGALASLLLGSTSLSTAETAPCPVVVVRAGHTWAHAAIAPEQVLA